MKKRRELDALVGNVKSRRKKSRNDSGHELLRSNDSESSECDDFHIAHAKKRETGLCSTCSTITFLLVLVCMLVCAGLIWMHLEMKTDLENLKMNLKSVESKGVVNSEDVLKLQGVVMHINKTLEFETKKSKLLLDNITAINDTILKLSKSLDEISEGIKAAPEIKQIPEKLKMFSTTLVEMGSDVSTLKETVKVIDPFHKATAAKLDNLTRQMEELKQAAESESEPSESLSPELAHLMQIIPQRVEDLNFTLSGQIAVMMKSLSLYEEKFVHLENMTKSLVKSLSEIQGAQSTFSNEHSAMSDNDVTSDQFKSAVTDIVQEMISQMGTNISEISPVEGSSQVSDLGTNITNLLQRINNLEKLQSSGTTVTGSVLPDSFDTLRTILESQIQGINSSLTHLLSDHAHVTSIVINNTNSLVSLTHQVNMTQFYIHKLEQTLTMIQTGTATVTTVKSEAEVKTPQATTGSVTFSTSKNDVPPATQPSTSIVPTENIDNENNAMETPKPAEVENPKSTRLSTVELTSTTEKMIKTESPNSAIVIPSIKNAEDLKNHFLNWSHGYQVKQVAYDDLLGFLGPNTPDEKDLEKFDTDRSGSYSLREFSNALGFSLNDEPDSPPTDETIPPR